MGFCNCSMFCCAYFCIHSGLTIISIGEENAGCFAFLSSWCLVVVVWVFLAMPWGCLRFVIVVFPDHTHLLFLSAVCNCGIS